MWAAVESCFLQGTELSIATPSVALQTQLQHQRDKQEGWQPSFLQSLRCPLLPGLSPATAIQHFPSLHRSLSLLKQ